MDILKTLTATEVREWAYTSLLMRGEVIPATETHAELVKLEIVAGGGTPGQKEHCLFILRYKSDSGFRTNDKNRANPEVQHLSAPEDSEEEMLICIRKFLANNWCIKSLHCGSAPVINTRRVNSYLQRMEILPPKFLMHCAFFQTQMAFMVRGNQESVWVKGRIMKAYFHLGAWMEAELEKINSAISAAQQLTM